MERNRVFDVLAFATHRRPHLDELAARVLIQWIADGRLGTVTGALTVAPDARFVVWERSGGITPDGRTAEEWFESDGVLALGVGGGPYDEHHDREYGTAVAYCRTCQTGKTENRRSTTDLIAERFGVHNHPMLQLLLQYVHANDCHGSGGWFDPARMIMDANRVYDADPEDLYQYFVETFFTPYWDKQLAFFTGREPYGRVGKTHTLRVMRKDEWVDVPVSVIRERDGSQPGDVDHEWVVDWAASEHGGSHGLIARQNSNGTIQIIVKETQIKGSMPAVIAVLRYLETAYRGKPVHASFPEMSARNTSPIAPNFHFQAETGNIYNGSASHRDVEVTRIPFDVIMNVLLSVIPRNRVVENNWPHIDEFLLREIPNNDLPESIVSRSRQPRRS